MTKLRIKELCSELGITQATLADKLGVTAGAVSQLLKEDASPSLKSLDKIANIIGVDVTELFEQPIKQDIHGCIWMNGKVHIVNSRNDIEGILELISEE